MLVISNTEELQAMTKNEFRGHLPEMVNSKIYFENASANNIIYCEEGVKLENCAIRMLSSNSVLYLSKSKQPYRLKIMIYHNLFLFYKISKIWYNKKGDLNGKTKTFFSIIKRINRRIKY